VLISYLLLATTGIHALVILYQTRSGAAQVPRQWRKIAVGLLFGAVLGAFVLPRISGYVVGLAWGVLVILPSYAHAEIRHAVRTQDWARTQRWARCISRVWPSAAWRDAAAMYQVMHQVAQGQLTAAHDLLQSYRPIAKSVEEWFRWQRHTLEGQWAELRQLAQASLEQSDQARSSASLISYLRAVAAMSDLAALLAAFEHYDAVITQSTQAVRCYCFVLLFAAAGRPDLVLRGKPEYLAAYPAYTWDLWLGTAYLNADDQEAAQTHFKRAAQPGDPMLQALIQHHIDTIERTARGPLTTEQQAALTRLEHQWTDSMPADVQPYSEVHKD
jgi:hypothetical protein